jgi:hypothetical protein
MRSLLGFDRGGWSRGKHLLRPTCTVVICDASVFVLARPGNQPYNPQLKKSSAMTQLASGRITVTRSGTAPYGDTHTTISCITIMLLLMM